MFKPIPKSDIAKRNFKVYKDWTQTQDLIPTIIAYDEDFLFDAQQSASSSNGFYIDPLYNSIKNKYYTDNSKNGIHFGIISASLSFSESRNLEETISIIQVPQLNYGEEIKPGTVTLVDLETSKTLSDDSWGVLTEYSGNVFYDDGLIIVNGEIPSYSLEYKSTQTIYENEFLLTVKSGEFNYSQNPSAVNVNVINEYNFEVSEYTNRYPSHSVLIKEVLDIDRITYYSGSLDSTVSGSWDDYYTYRHSDPTGSYLTTYITSIGLYDADNNLVAVAKLPNPIKNLPDYDITFLIRLDI